MAEISVQNNSGSDVLTKVWAAAAIIAVLALMGWLLSQEGTTSSTAVGGADTTEAEAVVAAEAVELPAVGAAPDQYVGRTIQTTVPVNSVLGSRAFWAEIPGANPFLVVVQPEVADVSWIANGASASVVGTVQPVTDADVDAWIANGVLQAEARDQVSFVATHYLAATSATPQ